MPEPLITPTPPEPTDDGHGITNQPPSPAELALPPPRDVSKPAYRLFTAGQIALGVFLGGPLAGGMMLDANATRLGRSGGAGFVLAGLGIVVLSMIAGLVTSLFGEAVWVCLSVVEYALVTWAAYEIARAKFGRDLAHHASRKGMSAGPGAVLGRVVLSGLVYCLLYVLFCLVLIAIYSPAHQLRR